MTQKDWLLFGEAFLKEDQEKAKNRSRQGRVRNSKNGQLNRGKSKGAGHSEKDERPLSVVFPSKEGGRGMIKDGRVRNEKVCTGDRQGLYLIGIK